MTNQEQVDAGCNVSGFIPSAESFDEALDDIVLKSCEALQTVDGGLTLLHDMTADKLKLSKQERNRGTLNVGVQEAITIRQAAREERERNRATGGRIQEPSIMQLREDARVRQEKLKEALVVSGQTSHGGSDPSGQKEDDARIYESEYEAFEKQESKASDPDLELELVPSNERMDVEKAIQEEKAAEERFHSLWEKQRKVNKQQSKQSQLEALLPDDEEEEDEELDALEMEIGDYIDLLHKHNKVDSEARVQRKEENYRTLNPEKGKGFGIWKDMRTNKRKSRKVVEQEQRIWEYVEDDDDVTVQAKPAVVKKAPSPENMLNRMKQKPETDDEKQLRITAMLDALDRRMALEAAEQSKRRAQALRKEQEEQELEGEESIDSEDETELESRAALSNKQLSFKSQNRAHDPYDDGIVHGVLDDFKVFGELGTRIIEEDCGIKTAGIKAILEDTRDALIDLPQVVKRGGEITISKHPVIHEIIILHDIEDEDISTEGGNSRFGTTTVDSSQGSAANTDGNDSLQVVVRKAEFNAELAEMELNPNRNKGTIVSGKDPEAKTSWSAAAALFAPAFMLGSSKKTVDPPTAPDARNDAEEGTSDAPASQLYDPSASNDTKQVTEGPKPRRIPVMSKAEPKGRLKISAFLEEDSPEEQVAFRRTGKILPASQALSQPGKKEVNDLSEIIPCWANQNQLITE